MKMDLYTIKVSVQREGHQQESFELSAVIPQNIIHTPHLVKELKAQMGKNLQSIVEAASEAKQSK